jgi:hypothetical protein
MPQTSLAIVSPRKNASLSWLVHHVKRGWRRLQSLCGNLDIKRFCSARLQAGTADSSTCPPEGRRYTKRNQLEFQPASG